MSQHALYVSSSSASFFNIAMLESYQVTFSSLDVHLHTEALLNAMNFLNNLLPPSAKKEGGQEELPTILEEDETEKEEEKAMETVVAKKKRWFSFQMLQSVSCFLHYDLTVFFMAFFFYSIKDYKVCRCGKSAYQSRSPMSEGFHSRAES